MPIGGAPPPKAWKTQASDGDVEREVGDRSRRSAAGRGGGAARRWSWRRRGRTCARGTGCLRNRPPLRLVRRLAHRERAAPARSRSPRRAAGSSVAQQADVVRQHAQRRERCRRGRSPRSVTALVIRNSAAWRRAASSAGTPSLVSTNAPNAGPPAPPAGTQHVRALLGQPQHERAAPRHHAVEDRPQRAHEPEHRQHAADRGGDEPPRVRGREAVADLPDARQREDQHDRGHQHDHEEARRAWRWLGRRRTLRAVVRGCPLCRTEWQARAGRAQRSRNARAAGGT